MHINTRTHRYFKKIVIVDISASLLEVAQQRVTLMGLGDIVTCVEHDATADSVFALLPAKGKVDAVTMSYSFSMIPDQVSVCMCVYLFLISVLFHTM